jgi:hypothetical protein
LKHWNGIRVTLRNTEMTRPQIIDKQTDPFFKHCHQVSLHFRIFYISDELASKFKIQKKLFP